MNLKDSLLINVSILILFVFLGCVSSPDDIEILGSWSFDEDIFTITNDMVTISDYARGTVVKYDNDNDYAVIFFDEHGSAFVNQKYAKLEWINLTETSVTFNWYEPQDTAELAEASTSIFQTTVFNKI